MQNNQNPISVHYLCDSYTLIFFGDQIIKNPFSNIPNNEDIIVSHNFRADHLRIFND